jgi:hypothetical protein
MTFFFVRLKGNSHFSVRSILSNIRLLRFSRDGAFSAIRAYTGALRSLPGLIDEALNLEYATQDQSQPTLRLRSDAG